MISIRPGSLQRPVVSELADHVRACYSIYFDDLGLLPAYSSILTRIASAPLRPCKLSRFRHFNLTCIKQFLPIAGQVNLSLKANIACAERRYDGASLIQINPATRRRLTLRSGALLSWLRTEHAMRRFCIDKGHSWLIAARAETEPGDSIKRR